MRYSPRTDEDLAGPGQSSPISRDDLVAHYRELRARYHARLSQEARATEALEKDTLSKERSEILCVAGHITGGLLSNPAYKASTYEEAAKQSVAMAIVLVAEVNR
jgi:hypothetical protein